MLKKALHERNPHVPAVTCLNRLRRWHPSKTEPRDLEEDNNDPIKIDERELRKSENKKKRG